MKLTREKALELHRKMWSEMQMELGDNPTILERTIFKMNWCEKWCEENGFVEVENNCFLCDYAKTCKECPIDWSKAEDIVVKGEVVSCNNMYKNDGTYYTSAPISKILAIPEREVDEDD